MYCLAAMNSPLGGLWKFSRNPKIQLETQDMHTITAYHANQSPNIKFDVRNSPNLVSMLKMDT